MDPGSPNLRMKEETWIESCQGSKQRRAVEVGGLSRAAPDKKKGRDQGKQTYYSKGSKPEVKSKRD